MKQCEGCKLTEPQSYCWEQRLIDCPSDKPPRDLDVYMLWECVRDLVKRVRKLERQAAGECAKCEEPLVARGLCATHYKQWQRQRGK